MDKKKIIEIFGTLGCASSFLVGCNNKNQFEIMFDNARNIILECTNIDEYKNKSENQILSEIEYKPFYNVLDSKNDTYYFKDIDYSSGDNAKWPCSVHVTRALQIAVIAAKQNNDDLMKIAYKLGNYYLCNNFQNSNWWYEIIGIPRDLSDLAFFTYNMSTDKEKARMLDIIRYGTFDYGPKEGQRFYNQHPKKSTGCNLYDAAHITLKAAILAKDQSELNCINDYLLKGIEQDKQEGYQSDGAFFQHGRMIQSGSYGRQGTIRLAKIAATFVNTNISAFPDDKLEIILNYIVNGIKYLTHKGSFNYSVLGRTYSRPTALDIHGGTTDLGNLDDLACFLALKNLPHHDEIDKLLDDLKNNRSTFTGIKYFPSSSLIAMNLDDIYIAYRGGGVENSNVQTVNMEGINGENELGYNLTYGTNTCVIETGKEYLNMPAIWEYDYLPGTTAREENDADLKKNHPAKGLNRLLNGFFKMDNPLKEDQSKDTNIVVNMAKVTHEKISYTVTCFATLDGMVILGAGLKDAENKPLHTTVEQCELNANPLISTDDKEVQHSNVLYRSLDNQKFVTSFKPKSGNWNRNNNSYNKEVSANVLKITYPNVFSYAYSIQPITLSSKKFITAINTEEYQAIELPDGEHILAAFYKAGSFTYLNKTYTAPNSGIYLFNKIK